MLVYSTGSTDIDFRHSMPDPAGLRRSISAAVTVRVLLPRVQCSEAVKGVLGLTQVWKDRTFGRARELCCDVSPVFVYYRPLSLSATFAPGEVAAA
jgi:hypothetical protein